MNNNLFTITNIHPNKFSVLENIDIYSPSFREVFIIGAYSTILVVSFFLIYSYYNPPKPYLEDKGVKPSLEVKKVEYKLASSTYEEDIITSLDVKNYANQKVGRSSILPKSQNVGTAPVLNSDKGISTSPTILTNDIKGGTSPSILTNSQSINSKDNLELTIKENIDKLFDNLSSIFIESEEEDIFRSFINIFKGTEETSSSPIQKAPSNNTLL
jgi:hypothetical protein